MPEEHQQGNKDNMNGTDMRLEGAAALRWEVSCLDAGSWEQ